MITLEDLENSRHLEKFVGMYVKLVEVCDEDAEDTRESRALKAGDILLIVAASGGDYLEFVHFKAEAPFCLFGEKTLLILSSGKIDPKEFYKGGF